jgi:hypothetical protein
MKMAMSDQQERHEQLIATLIKTLGQDPAQAKPAPAAAPISSSPP